jgi:hypothetical protein
VNIHVSSDQQIIANPSRVDIAKLDGITQPHDAFACHGPRGVASADDDGSDVRVHFVDKPCGEKRSVNTGAPLDEHAEKASAPEFVEQGPELYAPVSRLRQHQGLSLA